MSEEEFIKEFNDWTKEEILGRAFKICCKNIELQHQKQDLLTWLESKNKIILQQHNIVEPVIKVQEVIDKIKEVM